MSTTVTKQKKSKRQSIGFDDEIDEMSDTELAELIERLTPKDPPVPFEMLPKELQEGLLTALKELDEGHFYTNEEVFREIDEWLENN